MKKKAALPIIISLLIIAGVIGFFVFFNAEKTADDATTDIPPDLSAQITANKATAFDFLNKTEYELPDNMKGFMLDLQTDINTKDTSESSLKAECENVFSKVDAILPNSVLIKYDSSFSYSINGFDILSYMIKVCNENNCDVFLFMSKGDDIEAVAKKYTPQGVVAATGDITAETKKILGETDIKLGFFASDAPDAESKKLLSDSTADFCFVQINNSISSGAENNIKAWATEALKSKTKVYAILRNDKVKSDDSWQNSDEIYNQVRAIYNNGGFAGYVVYSHKKLQNNDNKTTADLYFYNEYFNDVEYTALTLTHFSTENNNTVIFKGTSDNEYPVHTWSTAQNAWQEADSTGENGEFTAKIPLNDGENKIIIKHKNALYTYYIEKVVDVMTSQQAQINEDTLTLTVTAHKGAKVWASVANTLTIELKAGAVNGNYATYSATYKLPENYKGIKPEQISYAAEYSGIKDVVMCGEQAAITPYNDHGQGTATLCLVTKNYAETTSTSSDDDTSDPTCTPQLEGSYAYVTNCNVTDNTVVYATDTEMKIHAEDSRLLLGGFKMPANKVNVTEIKNDKKTTVTFSVDYLTFTRITVSPQEYYTGALERIYNVEAFTGEYIDVMFMNTSETSYSVTPDFSGSDVISKAEWYLNEEKGFVTMRLYFKTKGDFAGYSLEKNADGTLSLTLKKTTDLLAGTVIMLDPGHGGYGAPGTYSTSSVFEQEIALEIANKTADILSAYGATVIITREGDDSLFLDERVEMIRENDPDIFVSIHCDGSENQEWKGTHSFYYKSYSMPLANAIHTQMLNAYRTYVYTDPDSAQYEAADKGCKFFPYMVTRVEECPSVLVECGYLTNANDANFLTDENGQAAIATAIAQGIVNFIENK